ncbi:hypothetical protein BRC90_01285 [Halobacteriales archaeon QS_4_69_34]|nr:MAG: hypothetical protein BRC90_01285 [Halobacteriales archaeon QS_4_69_34]
MGAIAGVSSSAAGVSATSLLTPVGLGVGGIFVAGVLVLSLAYFDLLDASERDAEDIQLMLLVAIGPLSVTFGGIVTFESIQLIGI